MPQDNKNAPESKEAVEALIRSTVDKINEALTKSGYMAKDEGQPEGQPDALADQAAAEGAPGEGAPAPAPEGAPAPGAEGAPAPGAEGQPGEGEGQDEMAAMAQHLQEMPEEELHMLLELVQGEMMQRQEAQAGAGEGQPAPGAEGAAPAPQGNEMQMSMKKEFSAMAKSMSDMAKAVEKLAEQTSQNAKEVTELKKSQAAKPASVATKPAASNRPVQVLSKSGAENQPKPKEELKKSDVEMYLMNEMRKSSSQRHPAVTTQTIAEMTYIKTPEQLKQFADGLRKQGVQIPA